MKYPLRVGKLAFLELFLDTAITAAHAVRALPQQLEKDLRQIGSRIEAEAELSERVGVRPRLQVSESFGYWPRLIVTDADQKEEGSPEDAAQQRLPATPAKRLKYMFLSERARAETVVEQRQPGLLEALIRDLMASSAFNRDVSRTLFHLLVRLDFKDAARQAQRLQLTLDRYTANLPWELLQADDEPLALRTRLVRQLVSLRYRPVVRGSVAKTACVIGDPSTEGFYQHFVSNVAEPVPRRLVPLKGAAREAEVLYDALKRADYRVQFARSDSKAVEVLNTLFAEPYRILAIAAHGMFNAQRHDGTRCSGVVLSDGIMLTAAEVKQMKVVPDIVFLNCCHLAKIDDMPLDDAYFASSISRELIGMGVRCVVAAGWTVTDDAALRFATDFFEAMVAKGKPFGEAIWEARRSTYDNYPGSNTWGAYQAYGDPSYRFDHDDREEDERRWEPVAPQELVDRFQALRLRHMHGPKLKLSELMQRVECLLRQAQAHWEDLPEVQTALGGLYGDFGPDGFERASAAYLRAIAADDKEGRVPVRAIEQLANLEARTGEKIGGEQGVALIDRAIARLTGLLDISAPMTDPRAAARKSGSADARRANAERWSLLGSAWKRKAAVLARDDTGRMLEALRASRDAYANGEGATSDIGFKPYAMLNRLQLDGILEPSTGGLTAEEVRARVRLAEECAKIARHDFSRSYDFWDAVMPADAQLAKVLLEKPIKAPADTLVQAYHEAMEQVPKSGRELDSVVRQLRLLATFLRPSDADRAMVLDETAERLEVLYAPGAASATPGVPARTASTPGGPHATGKRRPSKKEPSPQPETGRKRRRSPRPRKKKPRS